MRKVHVAVIAIMLASSLAVYASAGSIPKSADVFGIYVPSAEFAIMRAPAQREKVEQSLLLCWNNVTEEEYIKTDHYLASCGCSRIEYAQESNTLTMRILFDDVEFELLYDHEGKTLTEVFPQGSRPELSSRTESLSSATILPELRKVFGVEMPNMTHYPDWQLISVENDEKGKITQKFADFTEKRYNEFANEVSSFSCQFISCEQLIDSATLRVGKDGAELDLTYLYKTQEAVLSYSATANPSGKTAQNEMANILPAFNEAFGYELPALGSVLDRWPSQENIEDTGEYIQVYDFFSDSDYKTVSSFLLDRGCELIDYETKGKELIIRLKKSENTFTIDYNRELKKAKVIYSNGSRPESFTTSPPTPTPSPTPTQVYAYNENTCWEIAEDYFYNKIKWHNPSSVVVHDHYVLEQRDSSVCFCIDYSAQVPAGGLRRDNKYIYVDMNTGKIVRVY